MDTRTNILIISILFLGFFNNFQKQSIEPLERNNCSIIEQIVKENKNKLKFKFKEIDSVEFVTYRNNYKNQIYFDSTKMVKPNGYFILNSDSNEVKLTCDEGYGDCTYYRGFINSMACFILTYCGSGYCNTYLLNQKTGKSFGLESPFDTECEVPVISKDEKKLIAFSNSVFNKESFISLYVKDTIADKFLFNEFNSFYTNQWRIDEVIWIDDNTLGIRIFDDRLNSGLQNERYLKAIIE